MEPASTRTMLSVFMGKVDALDARDECGGRESKSEPARPAARPKLLFVDAHGERWREVSARRAVRVREEVHVDPPDLAAAELKIAGAFPLVRHGGKAAPHPGDQRGRDR